MSSKGPFGFDPEDFDLRDVFDQIGRFLNNPSGSAGWSAFFEDFARSSRRQRNPETAGEAGDGVWAVYTVDENGGAHIEEVYPSELDALRAHKDNTDPSRKVRFLPYGIGVSVLDATDDAGS